MAVGGACTDAPPATTAAREDRPNILMIVTDDQPIGTMKVMPKTRRWFAREGVTFKHMYSTTPVCCPARASLMTGNYAHNHRVLTNTDAERLDQSATLQAHLKDAGYTTASFGKYLNLWQGDPPHFDEWAVIKGRARYFGSSWDVGGQDQVVPGYWTDSVANFAVDFVARAERDDERPWFMLVTPPAPHSPYIPAPRDEDAAVPAMPRSPGVAETDKDDKPPYVRAATAPADALEFVPRQQQRSLLAVDDLVDDVMRSLESHGEDDTLAFFVSDNGYLWGEHGLIGAYMSKGNPYTRSVQVPAYMRWPGRVEEATTDDRLASLGDIGVTAFDAAGIGVERDGKSLLRRWRRPQILLEFWQKVGHHRSTVPDWAALRTKDHNYVEYYVDDRIAFREYYDLVTDPHELNNLLGDDDPSNDPDVGALSERLSEARTCAGRSCP